MSLPYNITNFYNNLIAKAENYEKTQSVNMTSYKETCVKILSDYKSIVYDKIKKGERRLSTKQLRRFKKSINNII